MTSDVPYTKFSVNISKDVEAALLDIRFDSGDTFTEIARKAFSVYKMVYDKVVKEGWSLVLVKKGYTSLNVEFPGIGGDHDQL